MDTGDLIRRLSDDVPPVRRNAVGRRLAVGLLLGALAQVQVAAGDFAGGERNGVGGAADLVH